MQAFTKNAGKEKQMIVMDPYQVVVLDKRDDVVSKYLIDFSIRVLPTLLG
jgi:hypothetical protein